MNARSDLAGNPVVIVRNRSIDVQVSQPSEGRPEVRRIVKLLLQARKLDQWAIEPDPSTVAAMELRHGSVLRTARNFEGWAR